MEIVSIARFEKETGIHISHLSGKMEGVRAMSSYAGMNPSCKGLMRNPETVCAHCYAYKQVESGLYPQQRTCLERNGKALSKSLLEVVPNLSRLQVFRFESHGDVINETHARNFIRISRYNPATHFAAFTKRPDVWKQALILEGDKPDNLNIVLSSPLINVPLDFKEAYPFVDVIFTVYEKGYEMPEGTYKCRCGKRSCDMCRFCYTQSGKVGEVLR